MIKLKHKPAIYMLTTLDFINIEFATRTPFPLLNFCHLDHQSIVFITTLLLRIPKSLELLTVNTSVPRHLTLHTEQSVTRRTLRQRHVCITAFIVHHHRRTVFERTIEFVPRGNQRFAQDFLPTVEHVLRD